MSNLPDEPPTGPAIQWVPTAAFVRTMRIRSSAFALGGAGAGVLGFLLYVWEENRAGPYTTAAHAAQVVGVVGAVALILGAYGLIIVRRMLPVLHAHAWTPAAYGRSDSSRPHVIETASGPRQVRVETTRWTAARLFAEAEGPMWVAGDLSEGGVIACPGGTPVAWARSKRPN